MSRTKALAAIAVGTALAATAAYPAVAHPAATPGTYYKSVAIPATGVRPGTTVTAKGTGTMKNTKYTCALVIVNKKGTNYAPNLATIKVVTTTAAGKVKCHQSFEPFKAKDLKGVVRHCPTSKADKAAHFSCAVATGDLKTSGQKSHSFAYFTAKRK